MRTIVIALLLLISGCEFMGGMDMSGWYEKHPEQVANAIENTE